MRDPETALADGVLVLLLATLAGCVGPGGEAVDAGPDVEVVCGPVAQDTGPPGRLIVMTEQYGSGGGVTIIDLETLEPSINVALTHDDVTARWYDGRIWILNRFGADNIMILDGQSYQLQKQFSVRPAASQVCNPHDLLFFDRCRAYLSCYEQARVYLLDPAAPLGDEIVGSIDLSSLADGDGIPEVSYMARVGGLVYLAVERLDRASGWSPVEPSYLAVVDPATDTLVGSMALAATNPVGPLVRVPSTEDLVVAAGGDWTGEGAGLLRIDTGAGTSELVLTSGDLGGLVSSFYLDSGGCGHAVVMAPQTYETALVRFCLDGTVAPCVPMGAHEMTAVALVHDGRLVVTDRAYLAPGIRIYDAATCEELTQEPIATGFSPGFSDPLLLVPARR